MWPQKFPFFPADHVVALQIYFRSPMLTFKLLFCYALNPIMPQRSSKAWASCWSVWLKEEHDLWKLSWKEKTSVCNLLSFLWHLPTGKECIWPSVAPLLPAHRAWLQPGVGAPCLFSEVRPWVIQCGKCTSHLAATAFTQAPGNT